MKKTALIFVLILIVLTACQAKATPVVGSGSAKLGDITMYYTGSGTGKPMLLIPGVNSCADVWSNQVEPFSAQYNVIIPELRGQCRTTDSDADYTFHLMAEDIVKLMDYLGINKAYVVGLGEGATLSIDLAVNHSDRLYALVAAGGVSNHNGVNDGCTDAFKNTPAADLASFLAPPEYTSQMADPSRINIIMKKLTAMWLTEPNFTADQLKSINVPTLILSGSASVCIRQEHFQETADAIPNAVRIALPAETEDMYDGAAAEFNKTILDFLKDK